MARRRKRSRGLGGTYVNPASAVNRCRREGKAGSQIKLFACAMRQLPDGATHPKRWEAEAWRLSSSGLSGARRRRRR